VCFLGQIRAAGGAAEVAPVLRGRALQIVDDGGRVRASISVLPAGSGGAETVLLRLITERGRLSGLALVGPTGTKAIQLVVCIDISLSMLIAPSCRF